MKFYICETCGNIITHVQASSVPVFCCGKKMTELVPGTTDAATEKHGVLSACLCVIAVAKARENVKLCACRKS